MSQLITVTGMVIFASPIGEYDKRVVILTKERGKLSAFAKGARRPQSHLAGATAPGSFGTFQMYEGRSSYTIHSADISHYFAELRTDVEAAYYAFYFFEFADYYAKEGNDERELLRLMFQTLRVLVKRALPLKLVKNIFVLKAIAINGEGPQVFQCVSCGCKDKPCVFSVKRGGLICNECGKGTIDGRKLNTSTLYAMQYIISAPIEKLYSFQLTDEVLQELDQVVERYREIYVDKQFKSLEVLQQLIELN